MVLRCAVTSTDARLTFTNARFAFTDARLRPQGDVLYGTVRIHGEPFVWSKSSWSRQKLRDVSDRVDGEFTHMPLHPSQAPGEPKRKRVTIHHQEGKND